jgi:RNA polymerase sigma-70 factor (sigma-E family)
LRLARRARPAALSATGASGVIHCDGMEPLTFEELCDRHYQRVVKTAYLITGDRQEALDITQEAYTRAFARWRQVSAMANPEGWLYRVVANLAISTRRRRSKKKLAITPPDERASAPALADPELRAALLSLTPAQRTVVVMRFYLDWSIADVATALGKRQGTVRALTAQGIARLRDELGPGFLLEEDDDPIIP